jgi:hypothetical protein
LLLLGGTLRFCGLSWGLRHPAHTDERVYVDNVVAMVEAGDLDHRFYTYPALFYYILAPGVALLGHVRRLGPDAFLVSRGLVALAGTVNIVVAYCVASKLLGRACGLAAALFLAVSPLDVRTAHQVRPDVLLEGFGLLALAAFSGLGGDLRRDVRAGALVGLATAIKFTGLLLFPFYLAARLLAPGPRVRAATLASVLALGLPVLLTPYAIIHYSRYRQGPSDQLSMYYKEPGGEPHFFKNVAFYMDDGLRALGPLEALLVILGAGMGLFADPRGWVPRWLFPLTTIVVMSTPVLVFPRLILPAMGVVTVAGAIPIGWIARRNALVATLVAALAAFFPLQGSLKYVNLTARPSPTDKALDWFLANVRPHSRVLETRIEGTDPGRDAGAMLGIDKERYEEIFHPTADLTQAWLAEDVDVVVTGRRSELDEFLTPLYKAHAMRPPQTWLFLGEPREDGPAVLEFQAPIRRARYTEVDPRDVMLSASENPASLGALTDRDPSTSWKTRGAMTGVEWIEASFPSALPIRRIELTLGEPPSGAGPSLQILVSPDGRSFQPTASVPTRPDLATQWRAQGSGLPLSQAFLIAATPIRALRVQQMASRREPWVVSELALQTLSSRDDPE